MLPTWPNGAQGFGYPRRESRDFKSRGQILSCPQTVDARVLLSGHDAQLGWRLLTTHGTGGSLAPATPTSSVSHLEGVNERKKEGKPYSCSLKTIHMRSTSRRQASTPRSQNEPLTGRRPFPRPLPPPAP